jgi:hypothetical protein
MSRAAHSDFNLDLPPVSTYPVADANSLLESTLTFVPRTPDPGPSPLPGQVVFCPSQPRREAAG